jgi:hypothetical protein
MADKIGDLDEEEMKFVHGIGNSMLDRLRT